MKAVVWAAAQQARVNITVPQLIPVDQGLGQWLVIAMTKPGDGSERALRAAIVRVGHSLFERGYVQGSAGNISARLADGGFLITPTDACLGELDAAALSRLDEQGVQLDGAMASKTLGLHRRVYATDAEAMSVVHTHSRPLVALTLEGVWRVDDILPPITPYYVMKVGHVPLIAYARPGDPVTGERVVAAISGLRDAGTPIRAVMLDRLGPLVWHRTPALAMGTLEELVETAALWRESGRKATPLDVTQIDELRGAFGARW